VGLFGARGNPLLSFEVGGQDRPSVQLLNEMGIVQATLAIRDDGVAGVALFDPQGQVQRSVEAEMIGRQPADALR
jgi:hypothetical protein